MSLQVDLSSAFGSFSLAAGFQTEGGLTALFGPSGAGKSSLLEMIGGIRRPDRGRIALGQTILTDTSTGRFLPPHKRRIGWVFQETRLFPHLTGRQNLAYGRWFTPRSERRESLDRVVDLLGLAHLLDRRPQHYSGGEKSRIAIGRALMADPLLLIMDEPLASLDDTRKAEILPYIERLRDEGRVEILYVTHSLAEVVRLANGLVLLSAGRVIASGPTMELMARFDLGDALGSGEAGAVIEAEVAGHDAVFGLTRLSARGGTLYVPALAMALGARVRLRIKARDVMIALDRPAGISALNVLNGTIVSLEHGPGSNVDIVLDCGGDTILASLTRKSAHDLDLVPGKPVTAIVKSVSFDRLGLGGRPAMVV